LFERELLAAVQVDLQFGEHLADDRAELFGQLLLGERRGRFRIDALEQPGEDLLLDAVDRSFEAFAARRTLLAGLGLAVGEARHRVAAVDRREALFLGAERLGLDRRELAATFAMLDRRGPFHRLRRAELRASAARASSTAPSSKS